MSVLHLFWIIPAVGSVGGLLVALMIAGASNDIHPEDYHGYYHQPDDLRSVHPGSEGAVHTEESI